MYCISYELVEVKNCENSKVYIVKNYEVNKSYIN